MMKTVDAKKTGMNILCQMEKAGITSQRQLSEMADLEPKYVSRWINGKVTPSLDALVAMADAIGCKLDDLVARCERP